MSQQQYEDQGAAEQWHAEQIKDKHPSVAATWPQKEIMSDLLKINVNEHTEKKGNLTYLSWAWAWAEVLKIDPAAQWEAVEYPNPDGTRSPCMWIGDTAMVKTVVTILGKTKSCQLAVMDNRNNAVKNPDARKISDAIMRCMTKAIGMHGLGLYIYAGEDLPEGEDGAQKPADPIPPSFKSKPTDGPVDVPDDRKAEIELAANLAVGKFKSGEKDQSYDVVAPFLIDNEEMLYLQQVLQPQSTFRAYIKFRQEAARKQPKTNEMENA